MTSSQDPTGHGVGQTEIKWNPIRMTATVLGSVVIPAHNEATVIRQCLDSLLYGFSPDELDVIVVCNGCTDNTADVVRSSGHPVRVIEVSEASKTVAIQAAEKVMTSFPRLYLDADVVLTAASARLILERLGTGGVLAARPPITYDTRRSGHIVKCYYRARAQLPSVMGSLWGAGVYGLSGTARARFGQYPEGVGEDLFVDKHFRRDEIEIVDSPPVLVRAPQGVADLLRILRRTYQGKSQHRTLPGTLVESSTATQSVLHDLARLAFSGPCNAIDVAVYISLAIVARLTLACVAPTRWERDDSSRAI